MSRGRRGALLGLLLLIPGVVGAQTRSSAVTLTDVTVEGEAQGASVRVRLSRPVKPRTMLLPDPWRLVLDFPNVEFRWNRTPASVGGDLIREVRGSQYEGGVARVVVELTREAVWALDRTPDGFRVTFPQTAAQPPAPRPPTVPRPTTAARPKGAPEVQGIIVRDEGAVAYIRDPQTNQVKGYRVGDKVGDAVIEKIGEREVVLTTPKGRIEVRLEERPTRP